MPRLARSARVVLALTLLCSSFGCDDGAQDEGAQDEGARFTSVENEPGTFDTDFVGEGGTVSESFAWENPGSLADYSMDITAAAQGRAEVVLTDAEGNEVASFTLDDSSSDDSTDGVSQSGVPGTWTIAVTVSDFMGDGSLHVGAAGAGD